MRPDAAVLTAIVTLGWACESSHAPPVVATLVAAMPAVQRGAAEGERWSAVAVGAVFRIGDAIRTGERGAATLRLVSGGDIRLGPDSVLRIAADRAYRIELGLAEIDSQSWPPIELQIDDSRVSLAGRSQVRVGRDRAAITVLHGSADVAEAGRQATRVAAGATLELGAGSAVRTSDAGVATTAAPPATPATPATPAIAAPSRRPSPPPSRQDAAGAHAPRSDPMETMETMPAPSGAIAPPGEIAPSISRLPTQTLDADGRRYRLEAGPAGLPIALRWPHAEPAPRYRLFLEAQPSGNRQTFELTTPARAFTERELPAGIYRWWYETAGAAPRRSPVTLLEIIRR